MRSRKSIFYRGIVFIASLFAITMFSSTKVSAACEVSFSDKSQYLTIGGNSSSWDDSGLKITGTGCSNLSIDSIKVNGSNYNGTKVSLSDFASGHYTIAYNYSYSDGSSKTGTIYRYLRILNSSFDTSNNYSITNFNLDKTSSVLATFNINDKYFANFIIRDNDNSESLYPYSTHIIIKDSLGRDVVTTGVTDLTFGNNLQFKAEDVIKQGNKYYVIGNTSEGNGVVLTYNITVADSQDSVTISSSNSYSSTDTKYNSGYVSGGVLYLAGQTKTGFPRIDKWEHPTGSEIYTHNVKGEYKAVLVINGSVYAVGYTKSDSDSISSGLYSRSELSVINFVHPSIFKDSASTKFNDIAYNNGNMVIVGESAINQIYDSSGRLEATNIRQGYHDGIILEVSSDGLSISNAHMLGGNTDDTFTKIHNIDNNYYLVTGTMSNGSTSLVYKINKSDFEAEVDITNGKSEYKINGMTTWNYGVAYYGEINLGASSVLNVYYPKTITGENDALLITLDNRTFSSFEEINLVKDTSAQYCDYKITFAGSLYGDTVCEEPTTQDKIIDTTQVTDNNPLSLDYVIDANTGVMIYIYRTLRVTNAPSPINLNSSSTGILRWYVYNRAYTYTADSAIRLQTGDFDYRFNQNSIYANETIYDMIDAYFEGVDTSNYDLTYVDSGTEGFKETFKYSSQTNAAFASLEMARKYAYYQEFSRVIKIDGKEYKGGPKELGANPYSGQAIENGKSFYIYYIDFRGNNASELVNSCNITASSITNCTGRAGYAFENLNEIKKVIELFLQYNNYFVSTRNTIYNGSIPGSEISRYNETLTTDEYVSKISFAKSGQLSLNVEDKNGNLIYSGANTNVYFGGKANSDGSIFEYSSSFSQAVTLKTSNGITYYEGTNNVFFAQNTCYYVYYSFAENNGTKRKFCLDTVAPIIHYKKENSTSTSIQNPNSQMGSTKENPLPIESNFSIVLLDDLDKYSFIYINGNRYPMTCSDKGSESCEDAINRYIKQEFKYDKNNPNAVRSIRFSDRLENVNEFFFVIGTEAPSVTVENESENGFTLVLNFYDKNPITAIKTTVSQQICKGTTGDNCYSPDKNDTTSITNSLDAFNEALQNYVYAVSYNDNKRNDEAILPINAVDGVYTINGLKYVIENGYVVEFEGYEDEYEVDENNLFTYNEIVYSYNATDKKIQQMTLFGEVYIPDETVDPISVIDNKFRFEAEGKEYEVVTSESSTTIKVLPQRYEIYNNNLFELNGIIYTIDFANQVLTYSNPAIATLKHIELDFVRTTSISGQLTGGIDIPDTVRVVDKDSIAQLDPVTRLPAYDFVEAKTSTHFNLVDGVYMFKVSQLFNPTTLKVDSTINVKDLEMHLGYAINHEGLDVQNKVLDFDTGIENDGQVALERLGDNFKYPINDVTLNTSSGLSNYLNSHFMNRTVYVAYTVPSTGVFRIRVYNLKNEFGLPHQENAGDTCKEIIIYGTEYGDKSPISSEDTGCDDSVAMSFTNTSSTANRELLNSYGIHHLFTDSGQFAFNGENTFYHISLSTYYVDDNGNYQIATKTVVKTFYIDSKNPSSIGSGGEKTIVPYIYTSDGGNKSEVLDNAFDTNNQLANTIGASTNVGFKVNWYKGVTTTDYRENKLMLVTILDKDKEEFVTYNLYQLVKNPTCGEFALCIDVNESSLDNDNFMVVFSKTGNYEVTFADASGNSVTYSFTIDKSAPDVQLTNASMNVNGNLIPVRYVIDASNIDTKSYYLLSYVNNPSLAIRLVDLSEIEQYCYYYSYNDSTTSTQCLDADGSDEYIIDMSSALDLMFTQNDSDLNVVLNVWAVDGMNNGNNGEGAITVSFWADYKKPMGSVEIDNLNTEFIDIALIDEKGLGEKTISVLSDDYAGKTIICNDEDGFTFNDSRYTSTVAPYKFVFNCSDIHNTSASSYPNVYKFDNTMYMKFYEVNEEDGVKTKTNEIFNFALPTDGGNARWIYITVVDSVGNEYEPATPIILPIFVQDSIAPFVSGAKKDSLEDPNATLTLESVTYTYPNGDAPTTVYLANTSVYILFNEPIFKIKSCTLLITNNNDINAEGNCNSDGYAVDTTYKYSDNMTTFKFTNNTENTYKRVIFEVYDFAGKSSEMVVVIIDRITPTIGFIPGGESDDSIEYKISSGKYDDNYKNVNYVDHVAANDDQGAPLTVNVKYHIYSPSVTYKNYIKINNTTYQKVNDFSSREGATYYLLIKDTALVNKKCVATQVIEGDTYCFVEDSQGSYYFDSLLDNSDGKVDDDLIWKSVDVIDNSKVGVYRISYNVVDYAGNISDTKYKKVFVNDTQTPDIDIYDRNISKVLYSNVIGTNDNEFEGKLNKAVAFVGKDTSVNADTRLMLYTCDILKYVNGLCDINYELFTRRSATKVASSSNILNLGSQLVDGVYKLFVYDTGKYASLESSSISGMVNNETVYSLTYNATSFYFAISVSQIDADHVINGNKYTNQYQTAAQNTKFNYSDINYYTITNGSKTSDVFLVMYDNEKGEYVDVSGDKAIGFYGGHQVEFIPNAAEDIITAVYRNENGDIVYEIKYQLFTGSTLMLHETYYKLDTINKNAVICRIRDDHNNCEDLSNVYKVIKVTANIYKDGEYRVRMQDRYGNLSQDMEALVVDNAGYTYNKDNNKATGINYWFTAPSKTIKPDNASYFANLITVSNNSDVNVLDAIYNNNFNSEFFYAFAHKDDAKKYLVLEYEKEINKQWNLNKSFDFYGINGELIQTYTNTTPESILEDVTPRLETMIFRSYVQNKNFSDSAIKQVAYDGDLGGSKLASSMYKYTYLLVQRYVTNGVVNHTYTLVGDTCTITNSETQECIKVDLKITKAGSPITLAIDSNENNVICRISGTGGSGEASGSGCEIASVVSGATYVFIDTDVSKYHANTVYYGVTAYTEDAEVKYSELGEYVALERFVKYSQEAPNYYVESATGEYIWLNSKWVNINDIRNTNLFNSCEFDGGQYSECVYVTYLSRYNKGNGIYTPVINGMGMYYYNYYTQEYQDKPTIMSALNITSSYSEYGERCDDTSCWNLPIKDNSQTVTATLNNTFIRQTNKKAYIELFNETSVSKLYEINSIMLDGVYLQVYSYATVSINGTYYNINNFIKLSEDRKSYTCIIDVDLESSYMIVITDRAGNQLTLNLSHTSITPDISYTKDNEETNSNVTIDLTTSSTISYLTKNNVKIYKYNTAQSRYEIFNNNICKVYIQDISDLATTKQLTLSFKYKADMNCSGIYKIEIKDSHNNTNYKEFVFNPYVLNPLYNLDQASKIHEYTENEIAGVLIKGSLRVDIDASINYLKINKYEAYSNLDSQKNPATTRTIVIKDFSYDTVIDTCPVVISNIGGNMYSVFINSNADHSCDGIYEFKVINRFSEEVINLNLTNLEGADQEVVEKLVMYGESTTIEIDTTAPDMSVMDSTTEQYFSLHIDEGNANYVDTKALIENKTISYTNKYITVAWGGYKEYSFAYLKYNIKLLGDESEKEWRYEKGNVTYAEDYEAKYQFKLTTPGTYVCEILFTDALDNEDVNSLLTIIITIEAPNVGFFKVNNDLTVGDQYQINERIGDKTVLKCIQDSGSGYTLEDCTEAMYDYTMIVNNRDFTTSFVNNYDLKDIISRTSYWLDPQTKQEPELVINLTVSVKGKPDIKTELAIIIDNKAPDIVITGSVVGSTYKGNVHVTISQEDATNFALVYKCDKIEDNHCYKYNQSGVLEEDYDNEYALIFGEILSYVVNESESGYFLIVASDNLGNTSMDWFTLDNEAPTITVTSNSTVIAPNMYSNANAVFVKVNDTLSSIGSKFNIEFTPLNKEDAGEITYNELVGLTKEGKYKLTPIDGVNNEGRSITFYIYRQAPKYTITTDNQSDGHVVNKEATLSWKRSSDELEAPIVSVTMDGSLYPATYNSNTKTYTGVKVETIGEHTFVITDSAGNRSLIMITINNTNKVCINGIEVEVKMQAYYNVDSLLIGREAGIEYAEDDVFIFALPSSQVTSGSCVEQGLLGYRTLDPESSNYLIDSSRNAELFNKNKYDFVKQGFISQKAINEVKNVGGTVVVFVVTKDIANNQLGYKVGTNFFMEDPVGWSMIFVSALSLVWPVCRIFIKKKVRVI